MGSCFTAESHRMQLSIEPLDLPCSIFSSRLPLVWVPSGVKPELCCCGLGSISLPGDSSPFTIELKSSSRPVECSRSVSGEAMKINNERLDVCA